MCGIVGVAGDLWMKDEGTFKRMLLIDSVRGMDSTGVAAIRINGDAVISKLSSHIFDLWEQPRFKTAVNGNASKAFIGHNRAATKGAITSFNAHPFEFDHIVGVHNGTLEFQSIKALEKELGEEYAVDSQTLFAAIAKMGLKAAMSLATGAWSIAYFNRQDNTFNLLRNDQRPMTYGYSADFKKLFFASEYPIIQCAVELAGDGQYSLYKEKSGASFFSTEKDVHYKWDLDELQAGSKTVPKPKARVVKGKETVTSAPKHDPFHRNPSNTNLLEFRSGIRQDKSGTSSAPKTSAKTGRNAGGRSEDTRIGTRISPFAGLITADYFANIAHRGCSYCFEPIAWGERGLAVYVKDDMVLCPVCSGHPTQNRVYSRAAIYA
jgi:predicted glutamine amidotransferase